MYYLSLGLDLFQVSPRIATSPFVYAENGLTKMPNAVAMPRFLQQCHVVRHETTYCQKTSTRAS